MSNVTIISDGTSAGTKVQVGDSFLQGLCKINIEPIHAVGTVRATITVDIAALKLRLADADIECTDSIAKQIIKDVLLEYKQEAET